MLSNATADVCGGAANDVAGVLNQIPLSANWTFESNVRMESSPKDTLPKTSRRSSSVNISLVFFYVNRKINIYNI